MSSEQIAYARARSQNRGSRIASSSSRTTTARSRDSTTRSSRSACSSTSAPADYPTLGGVIDRALTDPAAACCTSSAATSRARSIAWIRKRIFPGAYPPTLREVFEHVLEPHDLSVLDVENLRLHYAKTLEHWRSRFEDASDEVAAMFDDDVRPRVASSISPARRRRSRRARCSCFRSCSRAAAATTSPGRASAAESQGRIVVTCDVLIVGGGPAGSACAWRLRQAGLDVVVIDGATSRATRCAPGGSRRRSSTTSSSTSTTTAAAGRSSRSPVSVSGSSDGGDDSRDAYSRPVSFGIRRCEFDHYLLQRSQARLQLGVRVANIRRMTAAGS